MSGIIKKLKNRKAFSENSSSVNIEMVNIPSGTFIMGSPKNEIGRSEYEIQHRVTLSAFKMSKYAVTFNQYDQFCEAEGFEKPRDSGWGRGERPVINITRDEAKAFAKWVGCRLPTEAEWEYACRAGSKTLFNTGNNLSSLQANFGRNLENDGKTQPVGSYPPNEWGLYEMHGNVNEWCNDWESDYPTTEQKNPKGPLTGSMSIYRGGCWWSEMHECRSANRYWQTGPIRFNNLGFRLVSNELNIPSFAIQYIYDKFNDIKSSLYKIYMPTIQWVNIPGGSFLMGSPENEVGRDGNELRHNVTLSPFKMSKYAVTFDQYDRFCEATGRVKPDDEGWGRSNRPVINVSWNDANIFAKWMGCRLPTEAEWEYACRAGTTTPFNTGNILSTSLANYDGSHSGNKFGFGQNRGRTLPVGSFAPNGWGLYEMHGNVWEWCSDNYDDDYSCDVPVNPTGSSSWSEYRVYRGGGWNSFDLLCRSAVHDSCVGHIDEQNRVIGFRLVLPIL